MSSPYPGSGPNGPNGGGVPPQNGQSWGPPPQPGAPQQNAPQQTPGYTGAPPQYPGSPTGAPGGPGGYGAPPQKKKPWPWIVAGCGCLVLILIVLIGGGIFLVTRNGDDTDPTAASTEPSTSESPTTEEPTTEEPTTEEPTTEEPTTEEPSDDSETGVKGVKGYDSTPVQVPTESDLEPAKQTAVDFLKGMSDGDAEAVCAKVMDPLMGKGIDDSSIFQGDCVKDWKKNLESGKYKGKADGLSTSDFDAKLHADGHYISVTNKHSDGTTSLKLAKGVDGNIYVVTTE